MKEVRVGDEVLLGDRVGKVIAVNQRVRLSYGAEFDDQLVIDFEESDDPYQDVPWWRW